MIALDTNVLVRFLTMDDKEQSRRAASLIEAASERGERLFVSHIVLCEMTWVLGRAYGLAKPDLVTALSSLLRTAEVEVEAADLANRAFRRYVRGHADFADYLVAERTAGAGCKGLATFDGRLLGEDGCFEP